MPKVFVTAKKQNLPVVAHQNLVGTPVASISGTPSDFGTWRVEVKKPSANEYVAFAREVEKNLQSKQVNVQPSEANTTLVAGLTITLGAILNDGDMFDIKYSDYIIDSA